MMSARRTGVFSRRSAGFATVGLVVMALAAWLLAQNYKPVVRKAPSSTASILDACLEYIASEPGVPSAWRRQATRTLVVHPLSVAPSRAAMLGKEAPTLWEVQHSLPNLHADTWSAFEEANVLEHKIAEVVRARADVEFVAIAAEMALQGEGAARGDEWGTFFTWHPHAPGLILLSLPGLSASGTQALMYVEFFGGEESGFGALVQLSKVDEMWKVDSRAGLWIS